MESESQFEPAAGSARAPAIHLLEVFVESVKEARAGSVPLKETAAAVAAVRPSVKKEESE